MAGGIEELESDFRGTERFEIVRQLGEGGMGVVYEAIDHARDTRVALKALRHLDPHALYRFKREFRTLHNLHHPNLVRIDELIEHNGQWFLAMELVPGVSFHTYVRGAQGPAPRSDNETLVGRRARGSSPPPFDGALLADPRSAVDLDRLRHAVGQLARGLGALHEAGKVHRDVKPSNVLVTASGKVVLVDFGVVADTRGGAPDAGNTFVGTVAYMAPEQAGGQRVGPPADWYALGAMIYEALTGRLPFEGTAMQVVIDKQRDEPPPPSALVPGVPTDLDELCQALLRRDPDQRADLDAVLQWTGPAPGRPGIDPEPTFAWPMIGRGAELATLRAAFDDVRGGGAVTVLLTGESGIGKSALIHELTVGLADADTPGAEIAVLAGCCYQCESVPYKALDGVIDSLVHFLRNLPEVDAAALLPADAALLRRVFPVLGGIEAIARAPAPRREIQDPLELRRRAFAALRQLLVLLSERHRTIISIDDLQWADTDSLLLLRDLLAPPDPPALLLIASVRTDAAGTLPDAASELPGEIRRVHLRSLAADDAGRLAALLLRHYRIHHVDADAIAADTDGHPLYLVELIRHLATGGAGVHELPRLDDAIGGRVVRLPDGAHTALEVVCLGGGPLPREVVRRTSELSGRTFRSQLAVLRAAHFVRDAAGDRDELEPYHDRVREAVVNRISPARARAIHERLAFVLDGAPDAADHPELLLHHLQRAGDARRAAEVAIDAAARATGALAFERAAELYAEALALGGFEPERARELTQRRAESLANAGRGREAAVYFEDAANGAEAVTRLECLKRAAEELLRNGHIEEGVARLRALLAELGMPFPATPRRALAALLWQRLRLRVRGREWTWRSPREIAERDLLTVDLCTAIGQTLGWVDNIRGSAFQTRGLRLALDLGEPVRIGRALGTEATYLTSQGGRGITRAAALCAEMYALVESTRVPFLSVVALTSDGICAYLSGQFHHAARKLLEAETISREQAIGAPNELAAARLARLRALRWLGAYPEMRAMFTTGVRDAERCGDRYSETNLRRSCAILFLAADDIAGAYDNLARATWAPRAAAFHVQHWFELESRGEIALYEGSDAAVLDEIAAALAPAESSMLTRVQTVRVTTAWLRGRLLIAGDRPDRAAQCAGLRRWIRQLRGEDVAYADVVADLLEAGAGTCISPQRDVAARWRRAAESADAHDLAMIAACARWRAGELTGGDDGAALLRRAEDELRAAGVVQPARFVDVLAPGSPRPGRAASA